MWTLKTHGETFYINHLDAEVPWSTKETPDNSHTKGSIKFKNALLQIDEHNCATLKPLTIVDKFRLRNQKLGLTRVIFEYDSDMHKALTNKEFEHSEFKHIRGDCTTHFVVCDLLKKEEATMASLKYSDFRILMPNEKYYQAYDNTKGSTIEDDE